MNTPFDWDTPAGKVIDRLAQAIRAKGLVLAEPLVVFGSAPLQLSLDKNFLSADVDIATIRHLEELKALVEELGLAKGKAAYYVEIVASYVFRPNPNWWNRVQRERRHGIEFVFPAPIDILLGKLHRLDEKDLKAFRLVIEKSGHPTEAEMVQELRECHEKFRPKFNGTRSDYHRNTERLWPAIYGHAIDVSKTIVQPVLTELVAAGYEDDYQALIRTLGVPPE